MSSPVIQYDPKATNILHEMSNFIQYDSKAVICIKCLALEFSMILGLWLAWNDKQKNSIWPKGSDLHEMSRPGILVTPGLWYAWNAKLWHSV